MVFVAYVVIWGALGSVGYVVAKVTPEQLQQYLVVMVNAFGGTMSFTMSKLKEQWGKFELYQEYDEKTDRVTLSTKMPVVK